MCRRFAVKARRYMECYIHKYLLKINATDEELIEWTHDEYEMMYKKYKSYRDTNVIAGAFISQVMRECICVKGKVDI